jgi:hypothetical protein
MAVLDVDMQRHEIRFPRGIDYVATKEYPYFWWVIPDD